MYWWSYCISKCVYVSICNPPRPRNDASLDLLQVRYANDYLLGAKKQYLMIFHVVVVSAFETEICAQRHVGAEGFPCQRWSLGLAVPRP